MPIRKLSIDLLVDGVLRETDMLPIPDDPDGCLLVIPGVAKIQASMVDLNAGMRAFVSTSRGPADMGGEAASPAGEGGEETWDQAVEGK